jgi:hypothetical protein
MVDQFPQYVIRSEEKAMRRYILASFVALLSLPMFAQSLKGDAPHDSCRLGNLYESSDPAKREAIAHFLTELKSAIKDGDKSRVAQLAHYPLSVETTNAEFTITSQKEFVNQYDRILPVELRTFLLKQQPRCVSRVGAKGFSVGTGQMWFDEYSDGRVRMFTINAIVYPGE